MGHCTGDTARLDRRPMPERSCMREWLRPPCRRLIWRPLQGSDLFDTAHDSSNEYPSSARTDSPPEPAFTASAVAVRCIPPDSLITLRPYVGDQRSSRPRLAFEWFDHANCRLFWEMRPCVPGRGSTVGRQTRTWSIPCRRVWLQLAESNPTIAKVNSRGTGTSLDRSWV